MTIVVVGQMGSGKSKLGRALARALDFKFLEVSTVVKSILGAQARGSLVKDSKKREVKDPLWLANPIKTKLFKQKHWVVSGVREMVVLEAIRQTDGSVCVVQLTCKAETRLKRCKDKFKQLSDLKQADLTDSKLGMDEVLKQASIIVDTDNTFKQTMEYLRGALKDFLENQQVVDAIRSDRND